MQPLLEEISRRHFPNPPASPGEIEEFERRVGWQLDPDLRAFYLHCNGADLFKHPDSPYRIHPLSRIIRARVAVRGRDEDSRGPASWYALCTLYDSNYIIVDTGTRIGDRYPIIDGQGETFPDPDYCQRIADSFSEFLADALRSEGHWFWLDRIQS
jgi:hypothetical protein